MALPPIRRSAKGLLPGGLKRRPANKTWRKGHHNKKGKWIKGRWVYRPGKVRKKPVVKRLPKPSAKPKAKKPRKAPRPPGPTRAAPRAKPAPKRKRPPKTMAAQRDLKGRQQLKFITKREAKVRARKGPGPMERERRRKKIDRLEKARQAKMREYRPVGLKPKVKVARRPWSSERRRRARLVANTTGASVVQADALIRRAKSKDWDYDTVNWDVLQGKDLTFAGRVRRLNKMVGRTSTKREEAMDIAAKREEFREQRRRARTTRRPPPRREEAARSRIEEEFRQRAEYMEQVLYGL